MASGERWNSFVVNERILTLASCLTGLRIGLAGMICLCILDGLFKTALILFFLAEITDLLDGHVARKYNHVTDIGATLDTIADKILIVSILAVICHYVPNIYMPEWTVVAVGTREAVILFLRLIVKLSKRSLPVDITGKFKMWIQSLTVTLILVHLSFLSIPETVLYWSVKIMFTATIMSGGWYLGRSFLIFAKSPRV